MNDFHANNVPAGSPKVNVFAVNSMYVNTPGFAVPVVPSLAEKLSRAIGAKVNLYQTGRNSTFVTRKTPSNCCGQFQCPHSPV